MNRIYLEDLRYIKNNRGISWKSVVGQSCRFQYNDTKDEIKILDYKNGTIDGNQKLIVLYKNIKFEISPNHFLKCKLGGIIHNIFVVNPYLCQFIVDDYNYIKSLTKSSDKYIHIKCPKCGNIRRIQTKYYFRHGAGCRKCGDGISYPEKFVHCVLEQLRIDFVTQYRINGFRYLYDFYLPKLNMVIEVDGDQHNKETNNWYRKERDIVKTKICKKNNIKIIRIKSYISDMDYIKSSITNNKEFCYYFDISKINWELCNKMATKSIVYEASKLFSNGRSIEEIAYYFKINYVTVRRYLKKGAKLLLCNYNIQDAIKNRSHKAAESRMRNTIKPIDAYYNGKYIGTFKSPGDFSRQSRELFGEDIQQNHIPDIANHAYGRKSIKGFTFEWSMTNEFNTNNFLYVYYDVAQKKYTVSIRFNHRNLYCGSFENKWDAMKVAKDKCKDLGLYYPDYAA